MTRWLCIADRKNAAVVKDHLVWGVSARYRTTMKRVHPGDTLLIYARQEQSGGEILQSVVMSAYEVISQVFEDATPIFTEPPVLPGEVFPVRVKVKSLSSITKPVPFKPLIPTLSFIKNKVMWTGSIRGAMREIPEEDFQRIVAGGM